MNDLKQRENCFQNLLLSGVGLLLFSACAAEPPPEAPIRPVRVQEVLSTSGIRLRTFSGITQAGHEAHMSFKVAGTIESLPVSVGNIVESGQLLATLDPADFKLRVQEAQASLTRAQAQARNAEANLARTRQLYENNNASRNEYDASRTAAESARAHVESLAKRLELAEAELSYTRLTAPVRGAITEVPASRNENINSGQTVLTLVAGSRLEVEVGIPEIFIAQIRPADEVEVRFDAIPDRRFEAAVTEVGVASTGLATTFPVTVQLKETSRDLRPGMAAEVSFRFGSEADRERILVRPFAVGEDREGKHVFVVEPSGDGLAVVHRRAVRVGEITNEGIEVLEGLAEGDLIVIAGVSRIQDGLTVKLAGTGQETP